MAGWAIAADVGMDAMNFVQRQRLNAKQIALAREQMRFQERMSSTAHQREVKDLRAAGLNPILSATGGSGAAGAPGAYPSGLQAPQLRTNARELALLSQQLKNLKATEKQIIATTGLTDLKSDVIAPASTFGKEIGEWLKKTLDIEMTFSAKDLERKGQQKTDKGPLNIRIPGFAKDLMKRQPTHKKLFSNPAKQYKRRKK